MVSLDIEAGSLAVLRFHPPYAPDDERAYLAALDEIALIGHPFVLLAIFGGGPALSQGGDREQALWFKRTRAHLERHCRACAMVRPGASEASATPFRRLWSFPFHAGEDEVAARAFLDTYRPISVPSEEPRP